MLLVNHYLELPAVLFGLILALIRPGLVGAR